MNRTARFSCLLVLAIGVIASNFVLARGSGSSSGYSSAGTHQVAGYTRSNETYVAPHIRSNPDGIKSNNLGPSGGRSYGWSGSYSSPSSSSITSSTLSTSSPPPPPAPPLPYFSRPPSENRKPTSTEDLRRQVRVAAGSIPDTSSPNSRAVPGVTRDTNGRIARSESAKNDFKRSNPCPATGKPSGPCPGYVIDHVTPLKRGGTDSPSNMQWQTIQEAKAKDRWE